MYKFLSHLYPAYFQLSLDYLDQFSKTGQVGIIEIDLQFLKGHSQLVHMRIRYHFLADLHITLHRKSCAEKRIL